MKRIGKWLVAVTVFVIVSRVLPVQAWTETYCWASTPAATSYRFDTSIDSGVTWTTQQTLTVPVVSPAACPAGSVGLVFVGSGTTLVLTRVEACNLAGCAIRLTDGFWHAEAFVAAQPPPVPSNIAIAP